jgi:two-component system, chemotaxis family, CheB/CheR fusion protein
MTISDGVLRLEKRERPTGLHMPIDMFLRSLASELRSNAIGVILSGTASDGTFGVAAIKGEGGISFAQDSKSAKYDGMPNNAIASGCIDFVLPRRKSPRNSAASAITLMLPIPALTRWTYPPTGRNAQMWKVFRLLKQVCKVDFTDDKPATVRRRVLRRMAVRRVENLSDYTKILQEDRSEVEALYQDILINVTGFCRDPESFQALRETVYPAVLKGRSPAETIRIWVPGCSTGEVEEKAAMTRRIMNSATGSNSRRGPAISARPPHPSRPFRG